VEHTAVQDAEVLALHLRPGEVGRLLTLWDREWVRLVASEPVDLGTWPDGAARDGVVTFPVDGPAGAVELAVAGLYQGDVRTVAAAQAAGGGPLEWWVLDLLARHGRPALDLRDVTWRDRDGLWWTEPSGPVRLPLRVDGGGRVPVLAATSILQASEALRPLDPIRGWLEAVAAREVRPAPGDWDLVLCARYLSMAVQHLTSALR
jgi:hypothetical protein